MRQGYEMRLSATSRITAGVGGIVAALAAVGAKLMIALLGLWTSVVVCSVLAGGGDLRCIFVMLRKPIVLLALAFAAFAALSGIWSVDAVQSVKSAGLLVYAIVTSVALCGALLSVDTQVARLIGGWFIVGFILGAIILLSELLTQFVMFRTILENVAVVRPPPTSLIYYKGNGAIIVAESIANWSLAFLNMVLWPTLLLAGALWRGKVWRYMPYLVFAVIFTVTFVSDHQTSWIAIVVASVTFLLACQRVEFMRYVVVAGFVVAVVAVVPLSQLCYHQLELQNREDLLFNLRARFAIWGYTADQVHKSPIAGVGADSTKAIQSSINLQKPSKDSNLLAPMLNAHAHNMLLQTWFELGAIGASIVLLIGCFGLVNVGGLSRAAQPYALATFVSIFVESIATWSIWHAWFSCTLTFGIAWMVFANRVSGDVADAPDPSFLDIWLPNSLKWRCLAVRRSS